MADVDKIRALTTKALDDIEGTPVSALVRRAHRIAVLRHDYAAQEYFMLQQRDLKKFPDHADIRGMRAKLIALLGEEAGNAEYRKQWENYQSSRYMLDGTDNIYSVSVGQIEVTLGQIEEEVADKEVPSNLYPLDAGLLINRREDFRTKVWSDLISFRDMLARIRQTTHDYLVDTEAELDAGREEASFFDQVHARINSLLSSYAPDAANKFVAAQDRITSGDAESIAHALTSCRRMIKSLADALYPATGQEVVGLDGIARAMSDDAYRNRLLQYVREKVGKHKSGEVLQTVISDLGTRLNTLDALSSKGVHAEPSIAEARTCVLQTYLLAGDLLSIADESSLLMADTNSASTYALEISAASPSGSQPA